MARILVCIFPFVNKKRKARKNIQVQRMNTYTEIPPDDSKGRTIPNNEGHDSEHEEEYEDLNTSPGSGVTAYRENDRAHTNMDESQSEYYTQLSDKDNNLSANKGGKLVEIDGKPAGEYHTRLSGDVDDNDEYEDMNHEYIVLGEKLHPPGKSPIVFDNQNGGQRVDKNQKGQSGENEKNGTFSGKGGNEAALGPENVETDEEDEAGYVMPSATRRLTFRKRFFSIFNKNSSMSRKSNHKDGMSRNQAQQKSNSKNGGRNDGKGIDGDKNSFPRKQSKAVKDVNVKKLTELYEKNK